MKCYAIRIGGVVIEGTEIPMYIKDVPRPISFHYSSGDVERTQYEDEAKHYKTGNEAAKWIMKQVIMCREKLEFYEAENAKDKEEHPIRHHTYKPWAGHIKARQSVIDILSNSVVVEVDVEVPSFYKKFSIRYDQYRERQGTAGKGLTQLCFRTDSRYSCKCCGIKLKKIPFYDFYDANNTKICIPCLYIRQEAIKSAFESMDEEFRTELHNELVIRSL